MRGGRSGGGGGGGEDGSGDDGGEPRSVMRAVLQVLCAMWASRGADDEGGSGGGGGGGGGPSSSSSSLSSGSQRFGGGAADPQSLREACAREISALSRALVLTPLQSRAAPPALRLESLDALAAMVAAPQLLMELYIKRVLT